jgi:hypothetical protein
MTGRFSTFEPNAHAFISTMLEMPAAFAEAMFRGTGQRGCKCQEPKCGCHDSRCGCCETSACPTLTTEIKWQANEGETRVVQMLVDNNRAQPANITPHASPWIDYTGKQVTGGGLQFVPPTLSLKPGESGTLRVVVTVKQPLVPGGVYFSEITLSGCSTRPITVGLVVNPLNRFEYLAACNTCCGTMPKFVESCRKSCGCPPSRKCSCDCRPVSTCEPKCSKCSPWPGCWDPHHHWVDDCSCDLIYLPRSVLEYQSVL